ncbi:hypothetical protein GCM10011588_56460 [Nocardia jinanensis]|uniref:Uncharacterized protein n=1 Tax=Nocardia jinanensis TaxID=382504 RepID=A0A917RVZ6_9NOCA|nr:hypothetical protein GCM10011588_56460 [Nocardia jinanensis]
MATDQRPGPDARGRSLRSFTRSLRDRAGLHREGAPFGCTDLTDPGYTWWVPAPGSAPPSMSERDGTRTLFLRVTHGSGPGAQISALRYGYGGSESREVPPDVVPRTGGSVAHLQLSW